jgi:glyoxylase-like metal-dependent hydrolase (beta-lactamase superfamily II)
MLISTARAALAALDDGGLLAPCEPDAEIAPGVRLIAAPGHTPGHVAVELDNGGDSLLYLADVVLHEEQFAHPDWTSVVDVDPEMTVATRRVLLDQAVTRGAMVAGFHLRDATRLSRDGPRYRAERADTPA